MITLESNHSTWVSDLNRVKAIMSSSRFRDYNNTDRADQPGFGAWKEYLTLLNVQTPGDEAQKYRCAKCITTLGTFDAAVQLLHRGAPVDEIVAAYNLLFPIPARVTPD